MKNIPSIYLVHYCYRTECGEIKEQSSQWLDFPITFEKITYKVMENMAKRIHYHLSCTDSKPIEGFEWDDVQIFAVSFLGNMSREEYLGIENEAK